MNYETRLDSGSSATSGRCSTRFSQRLRPRKSLVLLYVKDLPLIEEPRAGERFLIGAGFVTGVDPVAAWEYSEKGDPQSILWERGVSHSIRPDFSDGFLLPYHRCSRTRPFRVSTCPSMSRAPPPTTSTSSPTSPSSSPRTATIAALEELGRVLELITDTVDGPWEQAAPGSATGDRGLAGPRSLPRHRPDARRRRDRAGPLLARRVLDELPDDADPWPAIDGAIAPNRRWARRPTRPQGLGENAGRRAALPAAAGHVPVRAHRGQARALFDSSSPATVIDNPYSPLRGRARDRGATGARDDRPRPIPPGRQRPSRTGSRRAPRAGRRRRR